MNKTKSYFVSWETRFLSGSDVWEFPFGVSASDALDEIKLEIQSAFIFKSAIKINQFYNLI